MRCDATTHEAVIGLEVHAQLATQSKAFCRCANRFGAEPNTDVCSVCLGYPGSLPTLNQEAVDLGLKVSLALGSQIAPRSRFDRKSYFYADLPSGYQRTQAAQPLAEEGTLPLPGGKTLRFQRLHLEEDAGKLTHDSANDPRGATKVDLNRAGVPLLEIVSHPDLRTGDEAAEALRALHQLLRFLGSSHGTMEEGGFRCDLNVSLRPRETERLGDRIEVKNLNSFRHVARAAEAEIQRQQQELAAGRRVAPETRSFDARTGTTRRLREKQSSADYRYFPEPDLPALQITDSRLARLARELPELPWSVRERLAGLGFGDDDTTWLSATPERTAYFDRVLDATPTTVSPQRVANWIKTEVAHQLASRRVGFEEAMAPARLASILELLTRGRLSSTAAKQVFDTAWDEAAEPETLARRLGLLLDEQDDTALEDWVEATLSANPEQVRQYRGGRLQVLGYLMGWLMRASGGRAEPQAAREQLEQALESNGQAVEPRP